MLLAATQCSPKCPQETPHLFPGKRKVHEKTQHVVCACTKHKDQNFVQYYCCTISYFLGLVQKHKPKLKSSVPVKRVFPFQKVCVDDGTHTHVMTEGARRPNVQGQPGLRGESLSQRRQRGVGRAWPPTRWYFTISGTGRRCFENKAKHKRPLQVWRWSRLLNSSLKSSIPTLPDLGLLDII